MYATRIHEQFNAEYSGTPNKRQVENNINLLVSPSFRCYPPLRDSQCIEALAKSNFGDIDLCPF